jgi:hypothetical protein
VAEIEVEGAGTFDSYKTLYGDPTSAADVAGIGEDAYYNGLNDWVDFRRGGKKYEVRVKQIDDSSRQKAAVVALARSADGRLS